MMDVAAVGNEGALTQIQGASKLVGLGTGSTKSGTGWTAIEGLAKTVQEAPFRIYKQPMLWPWDFRVPLARFDLEATGAFSITSHLLHHATWDSSQMRVVPADFVSALKEIDALKDLPEGWNGYGAAAPNRAAVKKAASWLEHMYEDAIAASGAWFAPSVIADAFGNVVFEWWEGERKLTVYVTPTVVEYVKVWGPDMFSDMEDGDIEGAEDRQALWRWLMG